MTEQDIKAAAQGPINCCTYINSGCRAKGRALETLALLRIREQQYAKVEGQKYRVVHYRIYSCEKYIAGNVRLADTAQNLMF